MSAGAVERKAVMSELYPQLLEQARAACRKRGLYELSDVHDVVQDACEVILTKWHTFNGQNSLWGWIGTIVKHIVIDIHREGERMPIMQDSGEDNEPGGATARGVVESNPSHEDCVERVLRHLNAEKPARAGAVRTIELIEFIIDHGTDTQSLADFLECSENGAKERKRYALQKFRELCAKFCETDDCAATTR